MPPNDITLSAAAPNHPTDFEPLIFASEGAGSFCNIL
jgi:hypothetical protein